MTNEFVRNEAKSHGVRMWQIADKLGIADTTFCKRLRKELSEAEKAKIIKAIYEIEMEMIK